MAAARSPSPPPPQKQQLTAKDNFKVIPIRAAAFGSNQPVMKKPVPLAISRNISFLPPIVEYDDAHAADDGADDNDNDNDNDNDDDDNANIEQAGQFLPNVSLGNRRLDNVFTNTIHEPPPTHNIRIVPPLSLSKYGYKFGCTIVFPENKFVPRTGIFFRPVIVVNKVTEPSIAQWFHLTPGCRIIKINGREVREIEDTDVITYLQSDPRYLSIEFETPNGKNIFSGYGSNPEWENDISKVFKYYFKKAAEYADMVVRDDAAESAQNTGWVGGSRKSNKQKTRHNHRKGHYNSRKRYN